MKIPSPFKTAALAAFLFLPEAARACVVCFGGNSADATRGFYWGVVLLLSLPFFLITVLGGLIFYHLRKHNASKRISPST
jgi:hypothetical protein